MGYKGAKQVVNIPPQIHNRDVIIIGENAFSNKNLTSVTIPNRVTTIGGLAFTENLLTSVTIPNSVTSIGYFAFNFNKLTSVTIPNSVTTIGGGAFFRNNLTSITIGDNVQFVPAQMVPFTFSTAFDGDFDAFYISNGRRAGTYTLSNGQWSMTGTTAANTNTNTAVNSSTGQSIIIVNDTGKTIFYVFIARPSDGKWPPKMLAGNKIAAGASATVRLPHPLNEVDRYHIKIEDMDGISYTKSRVLVTAGRMIVFTKADIGEYVN